jgi:GT2 family glycosyltransferase
MAAECVKGIFETTEGHDPEVIVAVDDPVPVGGETVTAILNAVPDADERRIHFSQCSEPQGCSAAWNRALAAAQGDPIVFAADDLRWEQGWLDNALNRLSEFDEGWGLVGFNDGHWGEELSTHYLMSRRFIVEVLGGVVAWGFYGHSFNDAEVNERARRAGRYAWCEEARVYHSHWLFGDREKDATDTRTLCDHGEAERIFKQRQAEGFPNDGIEPVIYE